MSNLLKKSSRRVANYLFIYQNKTHYEHLEDWLVFRFIDMIVKNKNKSIDKKKYKLSSNIKYKL